MPLSPPRALGLAASRSASHRRRSAAPRHAGVPYLEVQQVLNADLNEGDVLTYSALAAGVDARTSTRTVDAQVSYRYERRIAWEDDIGDEDVHTGLAAVRAELVPNTLTMNAGALATRARADGRGPIFGFGNVDSVNQVDVYSVYAGPDYSSSHGPLDVAASYRLGYVKVDDHSLAGLPLVPGASVYDRYDSSTNQTAKVSIACSRASSVRLDRRGGLCREDVDRLDQSYEAPSCAATSPAVPDLASPPAPDMRKSSISAGFRADRTGAAISHPGGG
jgi:hypothetical protein